VDCGAISDLAVLIPIVHCLMIVQGIFGGSTIDTGPTKWITTEFGIGLTIASVVMAIDHAIELVLQRARGNAE
jgi:hypothetical protein